MSTNTITIDINKVKKVLNLCPYYDDIINYNIKYDDELSFDLIDWYKDLIFSYNEDNLKDFEIIRLIDKSMYMYINNYDYQRGFKKIISIKDIDLNSINKRNRLIKKILNYTEKFEKMEIFNIKSTKWI